VTEKVKAMAEAQTAEALALAQGKSVTGLRSNPNDTDAAQILLFGESSLSVRKV
jgi:hypothetical protein